MPLDQFILGPGKTALRKGEVLASVRVKKPASSTTQHFEKVGQRKAMSISIASFAALASLNGQGRIERASLAWGSVGPTVVRSRDAEEALVGKKLTVEDLKKIFPTVEAAVAPIDDVRAGASYRRHVSVNLLLRLAAGGQVGS
jgi:xanthine dehydrogenase FAD-binding subunit